MQLHISPNLTYKQTKINSILSGDIGINKLDIDYDALLNEKTISNTIREDIIFENESDKSYVSPWWYKPFFMNVALKTKNYVNVKSDNFIAALKGEIAVNKSPQEYITAKRVIAFCFRKN